MAPVNVSPVLGEEEDPGLEEGYLQVDSIKIRYIAAGKGPGVILLHGLGGSVVAWQEVLLPLAKGHRVYAIDLPGHGHSDKPKFDYSLAYARSFLTKFLEALNWEKISLIGISTGGLIALDYALNAPDRVERLVLVDAAGLGREMAPFLRIPTLPVIGEILTRPRRSGVKGLVKRLFYDPSRASPKLIEDLYRERAMPGAAESLLRGLRAGVTLRGLRKHIILLDRLPLLRVPTLIIWGKEDKLMPVAHAHMAHRLVPGSKLYIIEQCGHSPPLERPKEFNRVVMDFFSGK